MQSCPASGSQPDTGKRVMLQNLSLHAKMGISKCSCLQVQNILTNLIFLIHLLDIPTKKSPSQLLHQVRCQDVLWQSLISLFWSHMTKGRYPLSRKQICFDLDIIKQFEALFKNNCIFFGKVPRRCLRQQGGGQVNYDNIYTGLLP